MSQHRPQLIAHRGYAADNPENTVAAMDAAAADSRTDAIEIDARATADERVIVFHDDDLSRLTDAPPAVGETPVWKLSYDEISRYTISDTNESIPLLEDVLAAIPPSITVNIELKHPGVDGLQFGAIDNTDAREVAADRWHPFVERALIKRGDKQVVVGRSCNPEGALAASRRVGSTIPLAPLVSDDLATGLTLAARHDAAAIHPPAGALLERSGTVTTAGERLLEDAHAADRAVNAWTVTTSDGAATLAAIGVNGLIADTPGVVSVSA